MTTEGDILLNINKTIHELLTQINNAKKDIVIIRTHVKELDNTYFVEDKDNTFSKLLNIFDDMSIEGLTQILSYYKNIVDEKINNICRHEWIDDDIDIDAERSQRITYCKHCEVSKK